MQMKKVIIVMKDGEVFEGGLVSFDADKIVLRLPEGGTMEVSPNDCEKADTTNEVIIIDNKPKVVVAEGGEKKERKVREKKAEGELAALKEGSKLAQVVALCKENPTMSRKELIALIVEKVGMSAAGASTYHQNAKPYCK